MKFLKLRLWLWYRAAIAGFQRTGERVKALKPDLDTRDGHIYGGLLVAAVGGWQISWPWTCIALGVVVMVLGIFAPGTARGSE